MDKILISYDLETLEWMLTELNRLDFNDQISKDMRQEIEQIIKEKGE